MTTASTSVMPQPGPGALPCTYLILNTTLGSGYHCLPFTDGETEAPGEFNDLSQNRQLVREGAVRSKEFGLHVAHASKSHRTADLS